MSARSLEQLKRKTGTEQMTELDDRWLSVNEIAKYLGVSGDTIYRWIDKQAMPAHRVGRAWKFKKDEVDAWVRSGGASDGSSSDA
ncbi:helix-turn-helix domain-containing protein [Marinobacter salarius]